MIWRSVSAGRGAFEPQSSRTKYCVPVILQKRACRDVVFHFSIFHFSSGRHWLFPRFVERKATPNKPKKGPCLMKRRKMKLDD